MFGLDSNLSFMISYKVTERRVAVRSIGWQCTKTVKGTGQ